MYIYEESLCPSLGSGPTLAQGPSALAPLLFGTTFHYLSSATFRRCLKTYLFDLASPPPPPPRRHRCALLPVDVTERLQQLHIWTPIWLLRHRAWLRQGCWCYRNLIDWYIYIYIYIYIYHRHRWPPSISRDDGCTRLSRCRPGRVVWRSWSAQSPGRPSWHCWQGQTERRVDTVGASAAAGVAGRCCNALPTPLGLHSGFSVRVLLP